jgi:hypothetical protein
MATRGETQEGKEMIKISRRAIATAAAVLAAGTGSVTWVATSASAATAKPAAQSSHHIQPCNASQLGVWVNADSGNGTAGTIYYHLDITNTSPWTCYLYGWPGVSARNWAGGQLGQPARRIADVPAKIVNVPPGGTAHAALGYVVAQLSPSCKPMTAVALKVYPPDNKGARQAFFPLPVCTKTWTLTVGRIQRGT